MKSRPDAGRIIVAANQNIKERQYWLTILSGDITKSRFPYDPSVSEGAVGKNPQMSEENFSLPPDLYRVLTKLSSGIDLKLHIILDAGLVALLKKYTGSCDIITGAPILKQEKNAEFINTILVFRTILTPPMTFRELLLQVRETIVNATHHQNFPMEVLADLLFPRSTNGNSRSLFDVALLLRNIHDKTYLEGITYHMLFSFQRTESSIEGTLEYDKNLYQRETIQQIIRHYIGLLEQALNQVNIPISTIDILSSDERHRLLVEFNDNHWEYSRNKTFTDLFQDQVEKTPLRPAIINEPETLNYIDLNEKANRLARLLRAKGAGPDTLVAVTAERSADMIIAVIAVMKSGGAYLPIDPDYPIERIDFMLKDSGARTLLAQSHLLDKIKFNGNVLTIEDNLQETTGFINSKNLEPINRPSDLVYIIYTSGSTGKSKGVLVQHNHFVNIAFGWRMEYQLQEIDVCVLQMASFSFDVFAGDLARTFLNGGKIVINPVLRADTESLYRLISTYGVTILESTPAYIIPLMKYVHDNNLRIDSLRLLILGSDSCFVRDYKELIMHFAKQMRIVNSYGVTEATIDSSYYEEYDLNAIPTNECVPIGKPLPNVLFYILDEIGNLSPPGVPGELYIGGDSVTRGYLDRPELTAEKFKINKINRSYRTNRTYIFYRTGDIARWLHDGNMEFLGRSDYQVKIRGYRIELGEIENKLLEHNHIKEALVIGKNDINQDKFLCGYYIADKSLDAAELREYLGKKLPDYMVPWFFVQLEKFPITPNGKIDRKALPDPENISEIQYVAPRDEIERALTGIWEQVLGLKDQEPPGIDHRFFDLGGNSLKAIIMISQIQKTFNVKLTLTDIFKIQTIRGMAEQIKKSVKIDFGAIENTEKKSYYPLTSSQKRLYVLQQMNIDSTVYNIPITLQLNGQLEIKKLELTFKKLIQRHESFRTSYIVVADEPVQRIDDEVKFGIEYKEAATEDTEDTEKKIYHFIRPFDLSKSPLFRVGVLKVENEKFILMVDMHHIISDGTSTTILATDFMKLYTGEELPPLRIQYKDYAQWQASGINMEALKKQENWWLKEFSGEIPELQLPLDYPRPAVQNFEGSHAAFEVGLKELSTLKRLTLELGVTLYMIILSIYSILLAKLSNQEEIIIGAPVAGRTHADLESIIGMFVNTLTIRTFPEPHKTFKEFLNEMKERSIAAFENQDYPFEKLVEKVVVNRNLGRNPLFDAAFILQNVEITTIEITELTLKSYFYENKIAKFDLLLQVFETGVVPGEKKLMGVMEYSAKLFKADSIERFIRYFKKILTAAVESPGKKIMDIEIIPESEKKCILEEFNATAVEYPKDRTIHQLFEEEVKRAPDHIALIGPVLHVQHDQHDQHVRHIVPARPVSLTYRQLNEQADRLAGFLFEKGVLADDIVGIMMEQSIDLVIGLLGILKSGGAYMPIDPGYPQERIDYMLKDSGARIMVGRAEERKSGRAEKTLASDSSRLAYLIYTSGSTGKPKGVMVSHRNVVRLVKNSDFVTLTKETRILQTGAPVFDAATFEIWGSLLNGGQLVLVHKELILDAHRLGETLKDYFINTMWLSAPLFNQLMEENIQLFASLSYLLVGGDKLSPGHINRVKNRFPHLKIINGYGPTENTTFSTTYLIEKEFAQNIPIGKPIANSTAYVIDKNDRLQPVGVCGELIVGGDGVAQGYINDPELTAEKFVKYRSYGSYKTYVFYKTGDLARWLPDGPPAGGATKGIIEFLGRIDQQVKIRGFRIEVGEIESSLANCSGIKEGVISVIADEKDNKYLCAYFVSDKECAIPEIRKDLAKKLPDYMIPSYFVQLEKFPLTVNGKIDREALPVPVLKMGANYIAPRDEIEFKLVEIWTEILGRELQIAIGVEDDFFEHGGHSLRAMTLIARIRKEFNVEIPLQDIFREPTVQGMARFIKDTQKSIFEDIYPVEKREYYFCSSAQKRLFFLAHVENIGVSYNMPTILNVIGKIDKARFELAIKDIIARHEALRTSFHLIDNEPVQRIHDVVEFEIEYLATEDCGVNGVHGVHGQTRTLTKVLGGPGTLFQKGSWPPEAIIKSFIRPFDLTRAPLLVVCLIEMAADQYLLLYDMHHIISDGTSSGLLVNDFIHFYDGEELPPLKIQYKDFSNWQNRLFEKGEIKVQEEYWLNLFAGDIPRLNLPMDNPRPASFSFAGESFVFILDSEGTTGLKQLGLANGTTLYMNLLAAFNVLLYKYTGQDDIMVGGVIAGRRHADLQQIIGMFVNTLVMRNYPHGKKTFLEFLLEVKENSLNAFENQDVQFEELVAKLDLERDPSRNPIFDICFVMQNFEQSQVNLDKVKRTKGSEGMVFSPYSFENKISQFDLTIDIFERGEEIYFRLEYCTSLFNPETPRTLARHFINTIKAIVSCPDVRLEDIELMTEAEKQKVLIEFNDTGAYYPTGKTLAGLFTEQVEKSPDSVAVTGLDRAVRPDRHVQPVRLLTLTYRELNEQANRLGCYLHEEKEVTEDQLVGLIMERSIDGTIAILGILKAGGAYAAIDPSLPQERIKDMIIEAGIKIAASQSKYQRLLNFLQWECPTFNSFLCIDNRDINPEQEEESELEQQAKLWEYVGETAVDDITGGGWISSYTGTPLSRLEMDEYGNNILEKLKPILYQHKHMRVLEIGCASGISMFRIAPLVDLYYGVDLSRPIIEKNRGRAKREGHSNIRLDCLAAHEIEKISEKNFDLVIINSVIQDFPGHNYLRRVIRSVVGLMQEKGYLFIGDVMDQDLKETLIRDMKAFKQEHRDKNYKTKTDFSMDLFLSREFFNDLVFEIPGLKQMDFSRKIFTIENELTRYRYDVLIYVDKVSKQKQTSMPRHKYQDDCRVLEKYSAYSRQNFNVHMSPHALAYVLYTSGTTGRPKGVMLEQEGVVNLAYWFGRTYGLQPGVNLLQLTGYSFDPSVEDIFSTLLHGGSLYVAWQELLADMEKLREFIYRNRIHIIDFIPSLLNELLCAEYDENGGEKVAGLHRLRSLKAVISGGEKLEDSLKDRILTLGYRLYNHYGPTEITVDALTAECSPGKVNLGVPIANTRCFILDRDQKPAAPGALGELCIAGIGLARGYLNHPELTHDKFKSNRSYRTNRTYIFYCTGDLVRWLPDGPPGGTTKGIIEFLGRIDQQVKIRGYRIELEEIRRRLLVHPNVKQAAVIDCQADNHEKYLCAYIVLSPHFSKDLGLEEIKQYLTGCLPPYMVPSRFVEIETIPLTPGGKIDRKALLSYSDSSDESIGDRIPASAMEKQVAEAWKEILQLENIGVNQNFFEIGGNSISILKVQGKLKKILGREVPIVKLFKYPTILDLASYLAEETGEETGELALAGDIVRGKELLKDKVSQGNTDNRMDIAVVGMAGYFPGASNVQEFWENLKNGIESIRFFTVEELAAEGVSPQLLQDPNFVRAASVMDGINYFDAPFFSYTPREASLMDPQVRIFHQCAWHALEDAGYDPYAYERRIGLYAGSSPNFSWEVLSAFSGGSSGADLFQAEQLWDKDFLCSRVSYRLNLKGPSFSIQTACSTSLVAVHLAVQGLLNGDCEMALAGGVTIHYPSRKGYMYQPGLVNSPDGHCRTFDVKANGTIGGDGAAVVLLKRLADARGDHDNIHAIIKGSAINNDGFRKVSYTAPSVAGQAEVIRAALVMAGVQAESINYIEAHGTGTELGDPVEIEALKLAFNTRKKQFCGIGSVKTNIGHLDTAAGTAGLIKTILALKHHLIPPSLHFHSPNPKLDLDNSPFYVVSRLTPWQAVGNQPRRAGVSSLGIGGTNAHVIVEESPPGDIHDIHGTHDTHDENDINDTSQPGIEKYRLLLLSARTHTGLEQATQNLVKYLENNPPIDPANIAYTLQVGRHAFEYRKILACPDIHDSHTAVENLANVPTAFCPGVFRGKIVFLFPGQGSQYVNMGLGLYKTEPVFREELDRCLEILASQVSCNLKEILYPPHEDQLATDIDQTAIAQPLIFSIQYALSKLLFHFGIIPAAMMGHSIGEYAAAHLAGVFSLEDALKLVATRGRLMQQLPSGAMLGVPLAEKELMNLLGNYPDTCIAAVNNTSRCVVSGPHEAIDDLAVHLKEKGCDTRKIHTSHAFHSRMMDPILAEFTTETARISRAKPKIPYISNLTGDWINEQEAADPAYWSRHLRNTVQFSRGLEVLMKEDNAIFIEIGPGRALSTMINRHEAKKDGHTVITLMRHPHENIPDDFVLLNGIGQLWLYGVHVHWSNLYSNEKISRISLPGYPFDKISFHLDDSLLKKVIKMITSFNVTNVTNVTNTMNINQPAAQIFEGESEAARPGNKLPVGFLAEEYRAPRNEFEKKIVIIWQDVLGFDQIGIQHNFFNLNGDSLSATQVISRIKDSFQVEVPLKDFFAEPTVAQLAQKVKTLLVEKIKNLSPEEKQKLVRNKENKENKG